MSISWTDALVLETLGREGVRLDRLREDAERGRLAIRYAHAVSALDCARSGIAGIAQTIERAALREDVGALAQAQERIQGQRARIGLLEETIAALRADQHIDALTGCLDRGGFESAFAREWHRAARERTPLGLAVADADRFEDVNAVVGHPGGDRALRAIARAIEAQATRPGEVVGRFGGDAFAVVVPHADLAGALALGERVRIAVSGLQLRQGEVALPLSVSVGVAAAMPAAAVTHEELLRRAEQAVSRAKAAGRAQAVALDVEDGAEVFYAPTLTQAHPRSEKTRASSRGR
jgi:diguanylate cyclase (GGDEF)-like protein